MNIPLFLIMFFVLSLFYFIVGILSSANIKNSHDYFLAERNLGLFSITLTLVATQLGGGLLLGTSQRAYTTGIYSILYTLGIVIGFLLLSCGFAAKMRLANVATTAELFEKKYHSPGLKRIASLLSIVALYGILIAQVTASRTVLLGIGVENDFFFVIFWLFVIGYTMLGGLRAVVATDIAQVSFILIFFGLLFGYSLFYNPQSLACVFSSVPLVAAVNFSDIGKVLLMPALFSLIEQDLAQRFFSAKNSRVATAAALFSGIILLLFACIPIYFGMQARMVNLELLPGANPLIPVIEFLAGEFVAALALCAVAAAITSTADSLLCAVSSNLAQDFDFSFMPIKNKLRIAQLLTLCAGLGALVASFFVPLNIIEILIVSYEISVSCLLVPLLIAYYKDDLNKYAAGASMVAGLFGFFFAHWNPSLPFNFLLPLFCSAIGYLLGNQIKLKQ